MSSILMLLVWGENSILLLGTRIILVPLIFTLIYFDQKGKNFLIGLLRSTYPLILSGYFYSETYFYNQVFMENIDPQLISWELNLFGMQPSLLFAETFSSPLFSELMYFGYFTFYLLIMFFTINMLFKKREIFKETIFKLTTSLYIFYTIFCFIPSAGPQFFFPFPENQVPDGFLFHKIMLFIQDTAEHPTGAFPSSHVGISVIILILSWKHSRAFFNWAWPFVILLILSTVYIKAHYAIDTIAGLLIAPFVLYLSDFLYYISIGINKNHKPKNKLHD